MKKRKVRRQWKNVKGFCDLAHGARTVQWRNMERELRSDARRGASLTSVNGAFYPGFRIAVFGFNSNAFHGFGRNWEKKPDCI
jgi:hypothetical protein